MLFIEVSGLNITKSHFSKLRVTSATSTLLNLIKTCLNSDKDAVFPRFWLSNYFVPYQHETCIDTSS